MKPLTQRVVGLGALLMATIACTPAEPPVGEQGAVEAPTWVGTITTEGSVTTVVNRSGSLWDGEATLAEDLSIGVEAGDEPYLLGRVAGLGVASGRIFVLDAQVLRVRVYDLNGAHLMDLGGEGDGPGEFRRPTALAVGSERVFVRDPQLGRITVFSRSGELLDTWPTAAFFTPVPIVATVGDGLFVPARGGMAPHGPEGVAGPTIPRPSFAFTPPTMSIRITEDIPGYSSGAMLAQPVPFWPVPTWALAPTGAMVFGDADTYRFTVEKPEGSRLVVESHYEPVAVEAEEADWHRSRVRQYLRQADPSWQWEGPEIPATKPAYQDLVPARSGEVWVVRPGPGYLTAGCEAMGVLEAPETCWSDTRIVEVFGADGRLSGRVAVPPDLAFVPRPVIDAETLVAVVVDAAGTIMVKRYRLVAPARE